jgi:predicted transglutaminase-like cysteine proteinase
LAEYSRGGLFARYSGIASVLAAVLFGTSASALAAGNQPETARYFTINEVMAKLGGQISNPGTNKSPMQIAALDAPVVVNNAAAWPAAAALQGEEPFGLVTFRAPEGLLWAKWRKLENDLAEEAQMLSRCQADPENCSNAAAKKYLALIEQSHRLQGRAKIAWINRTINSTIRYTSDQDQYGVPDLWSAPLATLGTGQGDCEDYAIAKYVALRDAGYSSDDLRLLIVRDSVARQDHAVTGVRHDGRWLMLDNRHDVLLENKDAGHFMPLFALDHEGVKLFAVPYDKPPTIAPALVATGPANTIEPAPATELDASGADALGLRLDTFEPPLLRGGF